MTNIEIAAEVEDLTVAYGEKPVLWDVDLKIPKGQLMAIVGPNGAGKTTMIKAMLGLVKPISGLVRFYTGSCSDSTSPCKNKIGYVPQSGSVDWDFPATVLDVVLMGRYGQLGWLRRPTRADKNMAMETLAKVGMQDYSKRQISQLSGGQQQRVFLARALVQQAELYFMDEPFKGVDAQTERSIVTLLKELRSQGKTVVVVHHDLQTVQSYFDFVALINLHLVDSGPVESSFTEENIAKTYRSGKVPIKGAV